jgi:FkbM family methyltransferase
MHPTILRAGRHLRALSRLPLWNALRPFRSTVTLSTRQGMFIIPISDRYGVAASLFLYDEFELDLMTEALAMLRREKLMPPRGCGTVLDIGANNGVISIGMLHHGQVARAIAIEPEPRNYALLKHNLELNHLTEQVRCLQYAASNEPATLEMEVSRRNLGDHRVRPRRGLTQPATQRTRELANESNRSTIPVKAERVDDLLTQMPAEFVDEIALIWIDIQGYESYAFEGAAKLLARGIPVVAEINPYMIERAGVTAAQYVAVCSEFWSSFHVQCMGGFAQHPIGALPSFIAGLGYNWREANVIFTR